MAQSTQQGQLQYHSDALEKAAVCIDRPCRAQTIIALNGHASADYFLMVFDAVAIPANGTRPALTPIPVAHGDTRSYYWNEKEGYWFTNGIVAALSSDGETYTAIATDVGDFTAIAARH